MGKRSSILPFFLVYLLSLLSPPLSCYSQTPQINVWPKPTTISWPKPMATHLSPSFRILSPYPHHPYLRAAVKRYSRLLLSERHHPIVPPAVNLTASPPLQFLTLSITDLISPLHHGVDESYSLAISSSSSSVANLTAHTVWGAMRGLETFSQLAWGDLPVVPTEIYISDRPIFPHRGLMLDTARKFYPVRDIIRTIRAMSYNKLNVFHWHITDSHSHSFPLLLPSEPRLAIKGSYAPNMHYSQSDVRKIVRFAMRHGVRVIPEIDPPGHTGSWAEAFPEIVTCANRVWSKPGGAPLATEPGPGQLNPLNPETYQVFRNVIRNVTDLFPDPFYHAGVDEVAPVCWTDDPTVRSFLSNGGTMDQLLEIFVNSTHPYIVSLNRTAVYWEDVITANTVKVDPSLLPKETTVLQTWNNGPTNTKQLTAAGYRVIVSSSDFYYLDCGHVGWVGNDSRYNRKIGDDQGRPFNYGGGKGSSWCVPFKTWQRVYDYEITYGLSEEEARLVLGGEVALWSEQADQAAVLDGRLWPRTAAMGEALWSGNRDEEGRKRYGEAMDRLNEWRYRMVGRGIGTEPIQPVWCVMHPGMCNLVQ